MAEEIEAAHSSTQQPVSRQKADKRLILTQAAEVIRVGEAMRRPGNDWHVKNNTMDAN